MDNYSFSCKDIGMNCGFTVSGKSMDELMPKISDHASKAHKMTTITEDLKQKITKAVKVKH